VQEREKKRREEGGKGGKSAAVFSVMGYAVACDPRPEGNQEGGEGEGATASLVAVGSVFRRARKLCCKEERVDPKKREGRGKEGVSVVLTACLAPTRRSSPTRPHRRIRERGGF